ncbi:hypothetical protein CDV31_000074 [Fusarium ambrosium]|uniref:Uncharacterized protein n=1 Tax=Fusarium ambrosium TaxID=131363 RepID=A0A428V3E1_9HYPO|nr:hypothetical protein CDV31_000074 [Fusarium ambrosium]
MDALAIYRSPPNRSTGLDTKPSDRQPSKPLVGLQPETLSTYINRMSAIFHTLKNMLDLFLDGADTPFSFSDEKAELLQQLFAADASMSLAPLVLETMKALLSQKLYGDPFQSPLLSALAILSVQRKRGGGGTIVRAAGLPRLHERPGKVLTSLRVPADRP